jgi:hypothetical protein
LKKIVSAIYIFFVLPWQRYCPSVLVLGPGQLLHINKGRIHAFRKQTTDILPTSDCHAELRAKSLPSRDDLCVSVAWDWQYRGVTSEGINREIAASLECAAYNRANKKRSLAIPETALLQIVRTLPSPNASKRPLAGNSYLCALSRTADPKNQRFEPSRQDILRGILPSLRFIVNQHGKLEQDAKSFNAENREVHGPRIIWSKKSRPNSSQNPEAVTVEPFGNDFFCRLCFCELSNLYFHCEGCEKILLKDFNICGTCFEKRHFATRIQMHPLISDKTALNHVGKPRNPPNNCKGCPCKQGPACRSCGWCPCSCQCHQWFAVNYRFLTMDDEFKLLRDVEEEVGVARCQFAEETNDRLELLSQYHASSRTRLPRKSTTASVSRGHDVNVLSVNNEVCLEGATQEVPHAGDVGAVTPFEPRDVDSQQESERGLLATRRRGRNASGVSNSYRDVAAIAPSVAATSPRKNGRPATSPRKNGRRARGSNTPKQVDDAKVAVSSLQGVVKTLKLTITVDSEPISKDAADVLLNLQDVTEKWSTLVAVESKRTQNGSDEVEYPSTPEKAKISRRRSKPSKMVVPSDLINEFAIQVSGVVSEPESREAGHAAHDLALSSTKGSKRKRSLQQAISTTDNCIPSEPDFCHTNNSGDVGMSDQTSAPAEPEGLEAKHATNNAAGDTKGGTRRRRSQKPLPDCFQAINHCEDPKLKAEDMRGEMGIGVSSEIFAPIESDVDHTANDFPPVSSDQKTDQHGVPSDTNACNSNTAGEPAGEFARGISGEALAFAEPNGFVTNDSSQGVATRGSSKNNRR